MTVDASLGVDDNDGLTLRERKRLAAREALSHAAIKLAIERGIEHVRVEDIAAEVGVSPRTFNNYFSSKEEAICAVTARRNARIADYLLKRPKKEPIWEAATNAVVDLFTEFGEPDREFIARFRLMAGNAVLRGEFLKAHAEFEHRLCTAIGERTGTDPEREIAPRLLAGTIASAMRVTMHYWLNLDPNASLIETVRSAMTELSTGIPTLNAKSGNNDAHHHDD